MRLNEALDFSQNNYLVEYRLSKLTTMITTHPDRIDSLKRISTSVNTNRDTLEVEDEQEIAEFKSALQNLASKNEINTKDVDFILTNFQSIFAEILNPKLGKEKTRQGARAISYGANKEKVQGTVGAIVRSTVAGPSLYR